MIVLIGLIGCKAPQRTVSNIERILLEDKVFPLDYPIRWSFERSLQTGNKVEVLKVTLENFEQGFPTQTREPNGVEVSLAESMYADAIADLLLLFIEKKLPLHHTFIEPPNDYLEYQLIHQSDTLKYRFDINNLPSEVAVIDSVITNHFFPDLIESTSLK